MFILINVQREKLHVLFCTISQKFGVKLVQLIHMTLLKSSSWVEICTGISWSSFLKMFLLHMSWTKPDYHVLLNLMANAFNFGYIFHTDFWFKIGLSQCVEPWAWTRLFPTVVIRVESRARLPLHGMRCTLKRYYFLLFTISSQSVQKRLVARMRTADRYFLTSDID